ncbi:MAG: IS1595 family transposase [Gammaproteobacteria bacterium]
MKYTFKQFQTQYPTDDACLDSIMTRRYGNNPTCPGCGVVGTKFHRIKGRRAYACQWCGQHVYPCVGTPFEHSSTPLTLWFHAMYLMTATRNGVSAKELQRQLGVTYKCAWRIGHELRKLMAARNEANNPSPISGHIEADETYVGGRRKGTRGRGAKGKTIVFGMLQREGSVKAKVVPNIKRKTLSPIIVETVAQGSTISTDELSTYSALGQSGYEHGTVHHGLKIYVDGIYHVNGIEGFWSHLKRGIRSTHASVSPQHLQKYVDEFSFRYNNRQAPADMFKRMLAQISIDRSATSSSGS